jgi:hypothetical protein
LLARASVHWPAVALAQACLVATLLNDPECHYVDLGPDHDRAEINKELLSAT